MKILYSEEHEWVKVEDGKAYIGITDYAQNELGDIVFVELPFEGDEYSAGETIGGVESIKTVSDLYSPVSGEVVKVNEELQDSPELLNEDPFTNWIVVIEMNDESELDELMTSEEYDKFCKEEE